MKKFLIGFVLFVSISQGNELCTQYSEYVIKCYSLRTSGSVKTVKEAYSGLIRNGYEHNEMVKKACHYGFYSETLHEANELKKMFIVECNEYLEK